MSEDVFCSDLVIPQSEASSPVTVGGSPASVTGDSDYGTPNVKYSDDGQTAPDVRSMADFLKKSADFSYNVSSASHTATATPGSGDGWGTPDLTAVPPTCGSFNVVHYDTNETSITLSGQVSGSILRVSGISAEDGIFELHRVSSIQFQVSNTQSKTLGILGTLAHFSHLS